jgi:hypothetical protein
MQFFKKWKIKLAYEEQVNIHMYEIQLEIDLNHEEFEDAFSFCNTADEELRI